MTKMLSAYYFMGQDLCIVPAHIRADMTWLKEHCFDAICVGVHDEQLTDKQPRGLRLVIEEAHALSIKVMAIPSRWCGLIAGWPTLTGHFTAQRPDIWMRDQHNKPVISRSCGPVCSPYHPEVREYMVRSTETMLEMYELDGIIWDELKTLQAVDYHPLAIAANNGQPGSGHAIINQSLSIFSDCNRAAKAINPELLINSFIYSHLPDEIVAPWAAAAGFDEVGCDGRPWHTESFGTPEHHKKALLTHGDRFIQHARGNQRRTFALIETQNYSAAHAAMTKRHLSDVLAKDFDHLSIYYHPLVNEAAGSIMDWVGPVMAKWRNN